MAEEPETPDGEQVRESTAADIEGGDQLDDVAESDDVEKVDGVDEAGDVNESQSKNWRSRWRRRAPRRRLSRVGTALVASAVIVAALAGLAGWLGCRAYEKHEAQARRDLFVQTARQGAVNLTTINYTEVETDVQRIIDSATGAFREDFEKRAQPFIQFVKAAQSKSEGKVSASGLESQQGDSAQVLVAVAVKSRTAGGEESPREWRMRIGVQAVGNDAKVSNVVFVP